MAVAVSIRNQGRRYLTASARSFLLSSQRSGQESKDHTEPTAGPVLIPPNIAEPEKLAYTTFMTRLRKRNEGTDVVITKPLADKALEAAMKKNMGTNVWSNVERTMSSGNSKGFRKRHLMDSVVRLRKESERYWAAGGKTDREDK